MEKVINLVAPPIPTVRIALIGIGSRGMNTLERYQYIKGAEIRYIADLDTARLALANEALVASGRPRATELVGADAWRTACEKQDVDLIYICTEWSSHTPIAVYAMQQGKHVAVEVPAATTVDECWQLVHTAEQTRRHCFMTENCCYDLFALATLEIARKGLLGTLTHAEGAYIHNLTLHSKQPTPNKPLSDTRKNWMEHSCALHGGNPYPTHGIGPIGQLLGFHRNDRMKTIVSLTSKGEEKEEGAIGRVNSSLIQTEKGVTILLQLDVTTPRPYSRNQGVCGTNGFVQKYPVPTIQLGADEPLTGEETIHFLEPYTHTPLAEAWKEGHRLGVKNEMNYAMDVRLIHCLNHGLPLDIDVYDAAEWSCLAELSQLSAKNGGVPVEIPNFMDDTHSAQS